ncbi:MAG: hypothetical protein IJU14_00335 [Clostridia bacterium]|nr:hypothetical protein [Clostridia bacterium]
MEDMLSRIVDMDEKVRLETQKAEQNKADTFKKISEKKDAIYNNYITQARERIDSDYKAELQKAEKKSKVIQDKQKECLEKMEMMYKQHCDKWVDEIVERVIGC